MDTKNPAPPAAVLDFSEKNFRPSVVETELYDWWDRAGFFTPPADPRPGEKKFVMMLPLPNITGDLHMGHALGFGGYEDLMARWHRMRGEPYVLRQGEGFRKPKNIGLGVDVAGVVESVGPNVTQTCR